jgi:hypothetical protein
MTALPQEENSGEDLQIEISTKEAVTDMLAVTITRANDNVESVVCVPNARGRTLTRPMINDLRPDPERFKSPFKDGRRSALGDRFRSSRKEESGNVRRSSGIGFIPDDLEDVPNNRRRNNRPSQRFHIRVAYPNGFTAEDG